MTSKILFVCLGNICRSPAAEGVFRTLMLEAEIDSCGTGGWHVGSPPHPPMQRAAKARGYDLSDLRARQFEIADFDRFDLIIVMDAHNQRDVEALRPDGDSTPVRLFTEFAANHNATKVPDPYYTDDYDGAMVLIEDAARGLKTHLEANADAFQKS